MRPKAQWGIDSKPIQAREIIVNYYVNTKEIPSSHASSHVKRSPLLWLHNKLRLSQQKAIEVKWFGISLVFTL